MERVLSDEERIRRAMEISERRNNNYYNYTNTKERTNEKKDFRLFKKMFAQIIICMLIYLIFYLITTTNYIFSEGVITKTREILNYDINLKEIYTSCKNFVNEHIQKENVSVESNILNSAIEENVNNYDDENTIETNEVALQENINVDELVILEKEEKQEKTQMEIDAEEAKKICEFQKPLNGKITSEFGEREVLSEIMSANHKGIDIAANKGTNIKSAIDGTVIVAEKNSEYGKFLKIQNGDVITVYAHCNSLKVKKGDKVKARTNYSNCWYDRKIYRATFTF